jgi:hypothetical protein
MLQDLRGGVVIGRIRLRQQGSYRFFLPDFCPAGKNLEEIDGKECCERALWATA